MRCDLPVSLYVPKYHPKAMTVSPASTISSISTAKPSTPAAAGEDAVQHRLWPDIRVPVGVGEVLRLIPDDVIVELAQHGRDIARSEGAVDRVDDVDVARHAPFLWVK